jgi:hypothetical protein
LNLNYGYRVILCTVKKTHRGLLRYTIAPNGSTVVLSVYFSFYYR